MTEHKANISLKGGPTAAVLALKIPEVDICVVDKNAQRIVAWNSDVLPISEPGLLDVVQVAKGLHPNHQPRRPNLTFSTDIKKELRSADMVLIAVETPSGGGLPSYQSTGLAPDMRSFYAAVKHVAKTMERNFILVNKSTLPCGTSEETRRLVRSLLRPGVQCEVLSNPEFLAEGTAIQDLLYPDRVLIGSSTTTSGRAAAQVLARLYARWVPEERVVCMNSVSCELSKLAANALLAQRISSINALSAVCENVGADVKEVSYACGLDHRIGGSMLNASVGFGGSCFKKDVLHLTHTASSLGLQAVASYFGSIVSINDYQTERCVKRVTSRLPEGGKVAVLGFAFKPNTGDTRESPAIPVVRSLVLMGYRVFVFDPLVKKAAVVEDVRKSLNSLANLADERVSVRDNVYSTVQDANAVVLLNPWEGLRLFHDQGDKRECCICTLLSKTNTDSVENQDDSKAPRLIGSGYTK